MRIDRAEGFAGPGTPGLFWLGQAGFWIDTGSVRVLIDPYLSDSLARKYAGRKHDHKRMMPPPVAVDALPRPDVVLVTHGHTDHMDPDTLGPLARRFPDLPFVVPAAQERLARDRIGVDATLFLADAGQALAPVDGLRLRVLPAAHERRETDALGRHLFLGYGIEADGVKIYHSGDCVPFDGLAGAVAAFAPDIALLPVNGRDAQRLADGIPGNFTLAEAVSLAADIPYLVPHHFGMFAFNTIDPEIIDAVARRSAGRPRIIRPVAGETLRIV
ncbi:MAG: MBL fold metallo-hydrolase [Maritimibacter sp.]|nr:MBL fold metallo-hydrolase [Maritimibacter sp.]